MEQKHLTQLRQILSHRFDEEGLRTLCFDLGVDYDSLPAKGKAHKARELVTYLEDRGRIPELVEIGKQSRSDILWPELTQPQPAHLFISHKHDAEPDQKLATYLHKFLIAQGHTAFIDTTMRTGARWLKQIDEQIKASDFLVVLLSKESADSEMVQAEVYQAYEYRKLQGRPLILPVRIAYEGLLPYSINAFLNPLHYVVWESDADDERVSRDILAAIKGRLPERTPVQ